MNVEKRLRSRAAGVACAPSGGQPRGAGERDEGFPTALLILQPEVAPARLLFRPDGLPNRPNRKGPRRKHRRPGVVGRERAA